MTSGTSGGLPVTDHPEKGDIEFLDERIDEFNAKQTGFYDGRLLSIFLKDADGAISAGLRGHTWGGCCEIKLLWVDERHRRSGIGSQILSAAEREARQRGCSQVVLSSHSFQAPGFHEKKGYRRIGEVEGYPSGYANILLLKQL